MDIAEEAAAPAVPFAGAEDPSGVDDADGEALLSGAPDLSFGGEFGPCVEGVEGAVLPGAVFAEALRVGGEAEGCDGAELQEVGDAAFDGGVDGHAGAEEVVDTELAFFGGVEAAAAGGVDYGCGAAHTVFEGFPVVEAAFDALDGGITEEDAGVAGRHEAPHRVASLHQQPRDVRAGETARPCHKNQLVRSPLLHHKPYAVPATSSREAPVHTHAPLGMFRA